MDVLVAEGEVLVDVGIELAWSPNICEGTGSEADNERVTFLFYFSF